MTVTRHRHKHTVSFDERLHRAANQARQEWHVPSRETQLHAHQPFRALYHRRNLAATGRSARIIKQIGQMSPGGLQMSTKPVILDSSPRVPALIGWRICPRV